MKYNTSIVILGAGFAKRMGEQKLLLPINGEPMIRHIAIKSLSSLATEVVAIVNDVYIETQNAIVDLPVVQLINQSANMGMSTSLQVGIRYLKMKHTSAAVILLADQPTVDKEVIDRVILEHSKQNKQIVQAKYQDGLGHPVLFGNTLFDELLQIQGDQGARSILQKYENQIHKVATQTSCPKDIDTKEDYEVLLKQKRKDTVQGLCRQKGD